MALKDVVGRARIGGSPPDSIRYHLHQHLSGPQHGRGYSTVHASELTKEGSEAFCPREYALADITGYTGRGQYLSASMRSTFRIGRDQEQALAHWLADLGLVIGDWECHACNHVHRRGPRPDQCDCGSRSFGYREMRFISAVSGAECGVDLLVKLDDHYTPVELKTIKDEHFKELFAPVAEHRIRTKLYLRILAESDDPVTHQVRTDRGRVLYICKGGYGCRDSTLQDLGLGDKFSPWKEFDVQRDDQKVESMTAAARAVADFRAGRAGVPGGICRAKDDKRAKACPLVETCFNWSGKEADDEADEAPARS